MLFTTPDILIVEDEELNRDIMSRRMGSEDYNIRFAVDGQKALDEVAEKKPDLILLDIMLPEVMGLQVLHTLRQSFSMVDLPIIMVTAIDEGKRIVRALELGANDYVTKPINFPILMARMQTQLSLQQLSALNKEFIATASHDLRKPLSIIHDVANQARHKLASGEECNTEVMLEDLTLIAQSSSYMLGIAECIVDSQTTGFGQLRLTRAPLHLEAVVTEVVERHRERANEKKIGLMSKHGSEKMIVDADRTRISQVLDNYVGNAIKFCSEGNNITISVKQDSDLVRVEVSDTGPGLTENDMKNLFMQDVELSNKPTDGETTTGLGLPICKQLIDLHDGQLGAFNNEATDSESGGATFWFSLPLFKIKSVDML
jgi:two-component system, sensor histidine kinase and response regulator